MTARLMTIVFVACLLAGPSKAEQSNLLHEEFQRLCARMPECVSARENARELSALRQDANRKEAEYSQMFGRLRWFVYNQSYQAEPALPVRSWLEEQRRAQHIHCEFNLQVVRFSRNERRELTCMIETAATFRARLASIWAIYERL
jgi:hypothetical protein